MIATMTLRVLAMIAITFVLAVLTGLGLALDWPTSYVAFGSWCGGVTFVLTIQEYLHTQVVRTT